MALLAKQELIYRASQVDYEGASSSQSTVQLVNKKTTLPTIDTSLARPPPPAADVPSSPGGDIDITTVRPSLEAVPEERPDSMQSLGSSAASVHSPLTPLRTPNSATPLIHPPYTPSGLSSAGHDRTFSASTLGVGSRRFSQLSAQLQTPVTPFTPRSMSRLSQWTDTDSFAALVPRGEVESVRERLRLDLDEDEVEDVGIVAEHARPGKPKLDRILADEVERAKGALAVACESSSSINMVSRSNICIPLAGCGPTSLDAMIRKTVAAQINPTRVRRGDMRGSIALFSEEFSY